MKAGIIFGVFLVIIGACGIFDSMFEMGYFASIAESTKEFLFSLLLLIIGVFYILINNDKIKPTGAIKRPY